MVAKNKINVNDGTDLTFDDQYLEIISQSVEQLIEDFGWTPELQSSMEYEKLSPVLKALLKDRWHFNQTHSIINYSGKTLVHWQDSNDGLQFQGIGDFHSFNQRYHHVIESDDKKRTVYVSKEFLKDPKSKIYEGVEFSPGKGNPKFLNFWKGWSVSPVKGNISKFRELIAALCNDDVACQDYLLDFLAHTIQSPETKPEVAIVMKGPQGIGKGTLMKLLGSFTQNYKHLSSTASLVGNFSGHFLDAFIVFADEAVWGGDKTAEGRLKAMITEPTMSIRAMNKDEIYVKSYIRLFVASNESWVVPVGEGDRRYFVTDCNPRYKGQTDPGQFFYEFDKWLQAGGREAVFEFLQSRDIANFNPRVFPKTQARIEMQIMSLNTTTRFIYEMLNGTVALSDDTEKKDGPKRRYGRNKLYADFLDWCKLHKKGYFPSVDDFGKSLAKALDFANDSEKWRTNWTTRVNGKSEYFYQVNSLKEAMERFAMNILEVEPERVFFAYSEQPVDEFKSIPNVLDLHKRIA